MGERAEAPIGSGERARIALERELYWQDDQGIDAPGPFRDLRQRLEELADTLRSDLSRPFPSRDPYLFGGSRWRRGVKRVLYRLMRPITRRRDRMVVDLAGMTLEVLDHLARAQGDVHRLEEEIVRLRRENPEKGSG